MDNKSTLTLGSLFDGSGGFPLGGLLAGITPVWASEIEPFPIRVTTKRLPGVKHYGDITKMNGAQVEPVDIITFGSPCQDMSIAGKRNGLDGKRSCLFFEAMRIVKEMRCKTNGKYPKYIVWENVPGAFSSNNGEDFKAVLNEIIHVKEPDAQVPMPEKGAWAYADILYGDGWSIAYRVLDAQYWGVPQRRRRIFLVADFTGTSAGEILFESEGLSGYSEESCFAWQGTAGSPSACAKETSQLCLNDQGGNRMDVTNDLTCTLRAEAHHPPCVIESAGFCTEHSSNSRSIGYEEERSPTLRAGVVPAAVYENHSQDTRYTELKDDVAPTVSSTYGTGGNNQPFIVHENYDVRFTSEGTKNVRHNVYKTETARTIDTGGNPPDSNLGGIAIVSVQGSMIGRKDKNGPLGSGVNENVSFTLNTTDKHAVAYGIDRAAFNQGKNALYDFSIEPETQPTMVAKGPGAVASPVYSSNKASFFTLAEEDRAGTLVATDYKDPPLINETEYAVRRLTPLECARLQGFPDWWCENLETPDPTTEDIQYWKNVFETHRIIMGTSTKPKSEKQIVKWLKNPHSDSAEYKMWGNGVALPCVFFVLSGIAWVASKSHKT